MCVETGMGVALVENGTSLEMTDESAVEDGGDAEAGQGEV